MQTGDLALIKKTLRGFEGGVATGVEIVAGERCLLIGSDAEALQPDATRRAVVKFADV